MAVDTSAPPGPPVAGPDRRPLYIGLVILVALLLAALLVAAVSLTARDRSGPVGPEHTVSGPLAGRHDARLDLTSGVGLVTVRVGDLGDPGRPAGRAGPRRLRRRAGTARWPAS